MEGTRPMKKFNTICTAAVIATLGSMAIAGSEIGPTGKGFLAGTTMIVDVDEGAAQEQLLNLQAAPRPWHASPKMDASDDGFRVTMTSSCAAVPTKAWESDVQKRFGKMFAAGNVAIYGVDEATALKQAQALNRCGKFPAGITPVVESDGEDFQVVMVST